MKFAVDFSNIFVIVFLAGTAATFLINQFLEFIDYQSRVKNGGKLPEILQKNPLAAQTFDTEKLKKISEYENAKYFNYIPSSICSFILNVCLVLLGFYPFIFNLIAGKTGIPQTVGKSFCFFFIYLILTSIPETLMNLPFSLYSEFVTEKKFGFSKTTFRIWITDQIKELLVGLVLGSILTFAAALFFVKFTHSWWFIMSAALIAFTFIMQIIYPVFIAPIFNKFSPLEDGEVKEKITEILNKAGFKNGGLFVMDASRRSGHSNAYFTGFGKSKRIVLYDTLIKSLTPEELAAVLGHELGHFKMKHILKRLVVMIPLEFIVMFVLYRLAQFVSLYNGFGFNLVNCQNVEHVQFIGLMLASSIYGAVSELISPVTNLFSRKNEYEADAYSSMICGSCKPLINGLIKLNSENLNELLPPKLYVFWNYSHPTLTERIEHLEEAEIKN